MADGSFAPVTGGKGFADCCGSSSKERWGGRCDIPSQSHTSWEKDAGMTTICAPYRFSRCSRGRAKKERRHSIA